MTISVVRVRPLVASRRLGIKNGEALFSDALTARFGVLSRDPCAVQLVTEIPVPEHERALTEWLTAAWQPLVA
jgi:hypothetical protein